MTVKIKASPISFEENFAITTFTLTRVVNPSETIKIAETIKINLKENGTGPFVQSHHYRKAVTAMLWSEMTPERIDALIGDKVTESSPEFEQAFNRS